MSIIWSKYGASENLNYKIRYPVVLQNITYNGLEQSPNFIGYNENKLIAEGSLSGVNAGIYKVSFTPINGYTWMDGGVYAYEIEWQILQAVIAYPTASIKSFEYNGLEQSPIWINYDDKTMLIGGTISALNVGKYFTTFAPKNNYIWENGNTDTYEIQWSIIGLKVPSQSGSLTYNGFNQSPTWANYDTSKMSISGTTNSKNAGSYTAIFTLNDGNAWSDGTTEPKSVVWKIGKQSQGSDFDVSGATKIDSIQIEMYEGDTAYVTCYSTNGDGAVSATPKNSYPDYVTASVNGKKITVNAKKAHSSGAAIIFAAITCAETTNYKINTKNISVKILPK